MNYRHIWVVTRVITVEARLVRVAEPFDNDKIINDHMDSGAYLRRHPPTTTKIMDSSDQVVAASPEDVEAFVAISLDDQD